jgi:protein MpaA
VLVAAALASLVIGHSAQGREIRATRVGEADAPVNVLVVGDVYGNEPAGEAIAPVERHADAVLALARRYRR